MGRQRIVVFLFVAVGIIGFFGSYLYTIRQKDRTAIVPQDQDEEESQQITYENEVTIPEPFTTPAEPGLAVPNDTLHLPGQSENKIRVFQLTADQNAFSFTKIIVRRGDVIRINAKALDKEYDFTIARLNIRQSFTPSDGGRRIEFQVVDPDTYAFSCESCKQYEKDTSKTQGTIVVVAKS